MFPEKFRESAYELLGESEGNELLLSLDDVPLTSIRFNPYKLSERPEGDPVVWNRYGFYLENRPSFTLDPLMHGGAYYVQEASSMFVEHIYRSVVGEEEGMRLLDLCAAPGGKATLYSTLVGANGLVVANEVVRQRASVLADNVRRWGVGNVAVCSTDAARFGRFKHWFDLLAVDAPCSGEGMFRKNREARREWSPSNVEMCAARQRKILADAWDSLRPGGILIYSTCTFNRTENEENVTWLHRNFAVEPVAVGDVPAEWGIVRGDVEGIETFRFYPHRARGEGFFVAVMRKAAGRINRKTPSERKSLPPADIHGREIRSLAEWLNQPEYMRFAKYGDNYYACYRREYQAIAALVEGGANVIYSGVCMGQLFGGKLRPDHALALFGDLNREKTPEACLSKEEAIDYLRKSDPRELSPYSEGINLVTYEGLPLGWIKRIGHRTNSLLPASFRIVNL